MKPPAAPAPPHPPLLRTEGLAVRTGGKTILKDVSFAVGRGELIALAGANGAGKSTLLRTIAGLSGHGFAGTVEIAGRPLSAYTPRRLARQVCYVAQSPGNPPPFTVGELVRLARYAHDDPPARAGADDPAGRAVAEALAMTGMEAFRGRPLPSLSGGERQMAFLASALAQEAELLLLDEPGAFLDIGHQEALLTLLAGLHRQRRATIIFATHDINAALHASRRVLGLAGGRLVHDGPPGRLAEPGALWTLYGRDFTFVRHPETGRMTVAAAGAEAARRLESPP